MISTQRRRRPLSLAMYPDSPLREPTAKEKQLITLLALVRDAAREALREHDQAAHGACGCTACGTIRGAAWAGEALEGDLAPLLSWNAEEPGPGRDNPLLRQLRQQVELTVAAIDAKCRAGEEPTRPRLHRNA